MPKHRWSIKNYPPDFSLQNPSDISQALKVKRRLTDDFIDPELLELGSPYEVFPDLSKAAILLYFGIKAGYGIGISGDYDVDGMTSTCLLLRAFREVGADADYAIPSRLGEGYGLNNRIVEDFHTQGKKILITVDNGTSAIEPIKRAKELGMIVIVTDHHEPSADGELPPADAILNPKFIPQDNVWSQVSGVGMAFVLGMVVAEKFGQHHNIHDECTELLTLGTIADMVALTGVNRRWVKRGLKLIPNSSNLGIQALMAAAGMELGGDSNLSPDDVGYKLAPRINSVGRIGEPQMIIDLFTTSDPGRAMELAHEVEELNKKRQELVKDWKKQVFDWIDLALQVDPQRFERDKVIYWCGQGVHKGIVGLIASAVVEKYGYPAFISSLAWDDQSISGSCRGGLAFNVFEALTYCKEHLLTSGGHKAAGGYSLHILDEANFTKKLIEYANANVKTEDLGTKMVFIDHELSFAQIDAHTFAQVQTLQPFGMQNFEPVFFTTNVNVIKQEKINYPGAVKFVFEKDGIKVKATAWDFEQYLPLPETVDIAYKLKENRWQGKVTIELNLESVR